MKVVSIGGGPAGLFFAALLRKRMPSAEVTVLERNRADDTFGWGVVFSKETLAHIAAADPESYAEIERAFVYWDDIETYRGGTKTVSTGHGFCGLSRKRLLGILQERCRALGVRLEFQRDVTDPSAAAPDAELVLAADGVNSTIRERHKDVFRPDVHWGRARFTWLGTTLPLAAFTFHFKETRHGLFQVHAYPFEAGLSTWIVECDETTWRRAGLHEADEVRTAAFCEDVFREELAGHRLLVNRSLWRSFPTVRCERWSHGNVVLVGDSAHTAHFSIGSGTKLALEDAIALAAAVEEHGARDVPGALAAYEAERRPEVERLQRAAEVSRAWFEDCARWMDQPPQQFTFNLMTRSHRITWDNLKARDPALVAATAAWFREDARAPLASDGSVPPPSFTPYAVRGMELANRIVVSPMCMYSATDGVPNEWHMIHLGSRAAGGSALVFTEMTNVAADARITTSCTGIWNDAQEAAWKRIVDAVHAWTPAKIGLQLGHAGRKGSAAHPWDGYDVPLAPGEGAWETISASAIPLDAIWPAPREMTRADMDRVRDEFVAATQRCARAGFDCVELHAAHGYLLACFLSPLSNTRTDAYGGSLANRLRFPLEVCAAVRAVWTRPLFVRMSASDWHPGGTTPEDAVAVARAFRDAGADVIDVSSGGIVAGARPTHGRLFNVSFADRIRHEVGVPVMTVGGVFDVNHAHTVLAAGRADLVALARAHLQDPYLAARSATRDGFPDAFWPPQYRATRPR